MPGDTLVVRFTRVRLSRSTAGSGAGVVGSALDPYYLADQKRAWRTSIPPGRWIAMPWWGPSPSPTDKLKNFKVPLRPMIGLHRAWRLRPRRAFAPGTWAIGAATWITTASLRASLSTCRSTIRARCCLWATAMPRKGGRRTLRRCAGDLHGKWSSPSTSIRRPAPARLASRTPSLS